MTRLAASIAVLSLGVAFGPASSGAEQAAAGQHGIAVRDELDATLLRMREQLAAGPFDVPMVVRASVDENRIAGDVHALVPQSFARVSAALQKPRVWCDVLTLHFNVKSCHPVASGDGGSAVDLRIATARKHYVPPSGRNPLRYRLDWSRSRSDVLVASLRADKAPFGIRDVVIEFSAVAAEEGSFVHLHYAYAEGWATRVATRTYLATIGRKKVGFSVVEKSADGEPVHVSGAEGAVERNALRYHLAIVAYFDTLPVHEAGRFEARIARWYDLTDRHRRQLFEMPRDEYLEIKRRERRDMESQPAARLDSRRP